MGLSGSTLGERTLENGATVNTLPYYNPKCCKPISVTAIEGCELWAGSDRLRCTNKAGSLVDELRLPAPILQDIKEGAELQGTVYYDITRRIYRYVLLIASSGRRKHIATVMDVGHFIDQDSKEHDPKQVGQSNLRRCDVLTDFTNPIYKYETSPFDTCLVNVGGPMILLQYYDRCELYPLLVLGSVLLSNGERCLSTHLPNHLRKTDKLRKGEYAGFCWLDEEYNPTSVITRESRPCLILWQHAATLTEQSKMAGRVIYHGHEFYFDIIVPSHATYCTMDGTKFLVHQMKYMYVLNGQTVYLIDLVDRAVPPIKLLPGICGTNSVDDCTMDEMGTISMHNRLAEQTVTYTPKIFSDQPTQLPATNKS